MVPEAWITRIPQRKNKLVIVSINPQPGSIAHNNKPTEKEGAESRRLPAHTRPDFTGAPTRILQHFTLRSTVAHFLVTHTFRS